MLSRGTPKQPESKSCEKSYIWDCVSCPDTRINYVLETGASEM